MAHLEWHGKWLSPVAWIVLSSLAGACTVLPEPLSQQARLSRSQQDRQAFLQGTAPVDHPITLAEAMARAIQYNLDHKLKRMEEALAQGQTQLSEKDILPKLTMQAGYMSRNNQSGASSISLISGVQSLEASSSAQRESGEADLTVAWNVLDFGLSYIRAQQQADRYLISQERRRKVIHDILQEVRQSFWRAMAAQRLLPELTDFLAEARRALADARRAEKNLLQPPVKALEYQMGLLETIYQITTLQRDLTVARTQLAALINLDLNSPFTLALPENGLEEIPRFPSNIQTLEEIALVHRPELREEDYLTRIDTAEARLALLQLLPGVNLTGGYNTSTNSFLYHQNWIQGSLQVAWNLVNLVRAPSALAVAEAKGEIAKARRLSMGMAVLTQLHVAKIRYDQTEEEYRIIQQMSQVARRVYQHTSHEEQSQTKTDLERVQTQARAIYRRLQKELAYAELQNAAGRLYLSVGVDPLPTALEAQDLDQLSALLTHSLQDWSAAFQRAANALAPTVKPLSVHPVLAAETQPDRPPEQPLATPFAQQMLAFQRLGSFESPLNVNRIPSDGDATGAALP
ncbi:MAG: TolC family protein [Magnetococcales bacterium]|nr:TolC family protein [Magnetococcales bacterium]